MSAVASTRRVFSVAGLVALLAVILFVFAPLSSAAAECKPAGVPDYAGNGINGSIDPAVEEASGGNYYGLYGWGGLRWNTCDIGSPIPDVIAELDTWTGNGLLGAGAGISAIMTAMHKWSADPGALLAPIDEKIVQLSEIATEIFFGQWAYALIVFAAIGVLVAALTRNVRTSLMTVLAIFGACAFVVIVSNAPLAVAQSTDGVASSIVSAADARALELAGIPAASPEGGGVYANNSEATGAILRDAMLQPMWRMGMTGSLEASDTTENLFKTSTASWSEVAEGYDPEEKRNAFNDAVEAVKADPAIENQYQAIKGQNYNRTGAGFMGMFMTLTVAMIRIPAEGLMFLGLLVIRFIPLIGPIFAALAIPEQTRPAATAALKIVAAAIFNVVVFGVIASVHTAITAILYVNVANLFVNTIISVLVTFLLLKLSKPYRSVTKLATGKAVVQELERAPDAPGNAVKGVVGLVAGTAIGMGMNKLTEDKKGRRDGKVGQDGGHPGPEKGQVHEGWTEAPLIHPDWGISPTGARDGSSDDDVWGTASPYPPGFGPGDGTPSSDVWAPPNPWAEDAAAASGVTNLDDMDWDTYYRDAFAPKDDFGAPADSGWVKAAVNIQNDVNASVQVDAGGYDYGSDDPIVRVEGGGNYFRIEDDE